MTLAKNMSLGCNEETIVRILRGGRVLYRTDKFNCSWGRVSDNISKGTFKLPATDGCCPPQVHAVTDKIEFERNGIIEWAGYVTKPVLKDGLLNIDAEDLLFGYTRRIIRDPIDFVATDVSVIAEAILTSADSIDPVPVVHLFNPSGVLADRLITLAEYRIAWDPLVNDLLKVGLDMTMVGTLLYAGPLENRGLLPITLSERMIEGIPTVGEDGYAYANRIIAKGADGLVSIYPAGPPAVPAPYPLVEFVIEDTDAADQNSLDILAKQYYDMMSETPRYVAFEDGVRLKADTPYPLRALIPGRLVRAKIQTQCALVQQGMRLESVSYSLTNNKEDIKISAVPMGTVPSEVIQ